MFKIKKSEKVALPLKDISSSEAKAVRAYIKNGQQCASKY